MKVASIFSGIGGFEKGILQAEPTTECERLQGVLDRWTEGISDTQRHKCLGNAVTVNVIEFIFRHIVKMMHDTETHLRVLL